MPVGAAAARFAVSVYVVLFKPPWITCTSKIVRTVKLAAVTLGRVTPAVRGPKAETVPKFAVAAFVPAAPSVTPAGSLSNWIEIPFLLISVPLITPVAVVCAGSEAPHISRAARAAPRMIEMYFFSMIKNLICRGQKSYRLQQCLRCNRVLHLHLQCFGYRSRVVVCRVQRGKARGGQRHVIEQPCHVRRRRRGNLRRQSVIRAAGVCLVHHNVKRAAYLINRAGQVLVIYTRRRMKTSRKCGRAKVQANIVSAGIGQRTEASCSYGWVVLENQRDRRLHAHGNCELAGTGLRRRARCQQTE